MYTNRVRKNDQAGSGGGTVYEERKMRTTADCMLRHTKKSVTPGGGGGCYLNRAEKSDRYMTGLGRTVPVDRSWIRRDPRCTRGPCRGGGDV